MRSRSLVAAFAAVSLTTAAFAQDHDHKHDHGKKETKGAKAAKPAKVEKHDDHAHHHEAPHGGTLIVFGDEFAHLELVLDSKTGTLTGYVLDGEAVKGIPVKQDSIELEVSGGDLKSSAVVTLASVGNPLTGEVKGNSSQFEGKSDALKSAKKFKVKLKKLEVKGQVIDDMVVKFPEGNH